VENMNILIPLDEDQTLFIHKKRISCIYL